MTTHEVLVAARNLLDREGVTQGGAGMDAKGPACAMGAVGRVIAAFTPNRRRVMYTATARHPAVRVLADLAGWEDELLIFGEWNDDHSEKEVLVLFDRAIAATAPAPEDFDPSLPVEEPVPA